jgi:hypothetical protein
MTAWERERLRRQGRWFRVFLLAAGMLSCHHASLAEDRAEKIPSIATKTEGMARRDGFFSFYWDEAAGKIWLEIPRFEEEFLYVHSLRTGLGIAQVGLDRGQIGGEALVQFRRVGPKVLLVQPNLRYRAGPRPQRATSRGRTDGGPRTRLRASSIDRTPRHRHPSRSCPRRERRSAIRDRDVAAVSMTCPKREQQTQERMSIQKR